MSLDDAVAQAGQPQIPDSVAAWARRPGPARLLRAARARLEAGQRGDRLNLDVRLDEQDRRVVSELLGLAWLGAGEPVTLGRLRKALEGYGLTVTDVVVACAGGPVVNARAARAAIRAQATRAGERDRQVLRAAGLPDAVIEAAFARRWFGGPTERELVCRQVATVWRALPAAAGTLLATFANDLFHDPHALDRDRTTGRAVPRLLAAGAAVRDSGDPDGAVPADVAALDARQWRALWAAAGVTCDRVSSTVLVLNLPAVRTGQDSDRTAPDHPVARLAALCAASVGEPLWLTGRVLAPGLELASGSLAGVLVRVCENPSVVEAAADAHGRRAAPLVCTYGRPSAAARVLLAALVGAGATLLVSADRDPAGTQISAGLLADFPSARAWLPTVPGVYEEGRVAALLADLL